MTVEVVAAEPGRWPEVDAVMGTKGGDAQCWCQYFKQTSAEWEARGKGNRDRLKAQVDQEEVPGLVALVDGEPAGWVALAPRRAYSRIARSPIMRPDPDRDRPFDEPSVWSITCFVIRPAHRGKGLMTTLIDAAVSHATQHGASAIEAYPVDPDGRLDDANLYHGIHDAFIDAGFAEVDRPRPNRTRVRMDLAG